MTKKIRWEIRASWGDNEYIIHFDTRKQARFYKKGLKAHGGLYREVKMYRVTDRKVDKMIFSIAEEAR